MADLDLIKQLEEKIGTDIQTKPSEDLGTRKAAVQAEQQSLAGREEEILAKGEQAENMQLLISGITKALAGAYGQKKGMDLSGVEVEGVNWQDRIRNRLDALSKKRSRLGGEMEAIAGEEATARDISSRAVSQGIDLAKLKQAQQSELAKLARQKNEERKYKESADFADVRRKEWQEKKDKLEGALGAISEGRELGDLTDEKKALLAGELKAAGLSAQVVEDIYKNGVTPTLRSKILAEIDREVYLKEQETMIYNKASETGEALSSGDQTYLKLANTAVFKPKLDKDVPFGQAAINLSPEQVKEELEKTLEKERQADTSMFSYFTDTAAEKKAKDTLESFEADPIAYTKEWNKSLQSKYKPIGLKDYIRIVSSPEGNLTEAEKVVKQKYKIGMRR